jgi:hypothetical protein
MIDKNKTISDRFSPSTKDEKASEHQLTSQKLNKNSKLK